MFSYRTILKKSWHLAKERRSLWFLGFLSIALASGGEYNIIANALGRDTLAGVNSVASIYGGRPSANSLVNHLGEVLRVSPEAFLWLIFLLLIVAGAFIFLLYIAVNSQCTLVRSSAKALSGKAKNSLDFKKEWQESKRNFWPVLSVDILMKAVVTGLFFIIGLPLLFMIINNGFLVSFAFSLLFVLLIPLSFAAALVGKYAIMYNLLSGLNFSRSVAAAWRLFKRNWLLSLEISFILFAINFLAGFAVIAIAYCLIMLPLMIPPFLFFLMANFILAFGIMVISGSVINVFQTAAWAEIFLRLQDGQAKSKIERLLAK